MKYLLCIFIIIFPHLSLSETWYSSKAEDKAYVYKLIEEGKIKSEWTPTRGPYSDHRMLLLIYNDEPYVCAVEPYNMRIVLTITCQDTNER